LAMQLLDGHSVPNKEVGEVFEQLGMNGALAVESKIAGCVHDSSSEMPLPNSIDDDPHRNRLLEDRFGKLEASAPFREGQSAVLREHRQEPAWNNLAQVIGIAAQTHRKVDRLLSIGNPVHVRIRGGHSLSETLDVLFERRQVRAPIRADLTLEPPSPECQESRFVLLRDSREHRVVEVAHINVHPQICSLQRHRLDLYSAGWAEVVVGHEFVWLE